MEPQRDLMQEGPGELGAKECGPFPSTFKSKRKSRFLLAKNGEKKCGETPCHKWCARRESRTRLFTHIRRLCFEFPTDGALKSDRDIVTRTGLRLVIPARVQKLKQGLNSGIMGCSGFGARGSRAFIVAGEFR